MLNRRRILQAASAAPMWLAGRGLLADAPSPARDGMLVHTRVPPNAEPMLDQLVESWITPTDRFYVRSHAPTPSIDPATYRLKVEGMVARPLSLSVAELKAMPQRTVTATMTCAGNRRNEHSLMKPVDGVQWQAGAIGNATWTGTPLAALLAKAGLQEGAKHVWFEGLDEVERDTGVIPFGASIPIAKATAEHPSSTGATTPGALVVHSMNGEPLTLDHGFPVRTVVPGYIGARSVKWLGRIVVSDRPSPNHYVATAYKLVQQSSPDEWSGAAPLETFVMNSVTCVPAAGSSVAAGELTVRGYALPPGLAGRAVTRVEVSADGGQKWRPARFTEPAHPFCWRLWAARVQVTPATESLLVRVTDSSGNVQPKAVAWNLKGYQFNAWHKTPISVRL